MAAAIQTLVLLVGIRYANGRYNAFLLALAASLPFQWLAPDLFHPHAVWERYVWLPCALVLLPAQAIAALEACFRFGDRYWLVGRISAVLGGFGVAGASAFWIWPHGDVVGQVVQVARYQRVACAVFLLLSVGFYGVMQWRGLIGRRDGAHLVLCALLACTWAVPILQSIPETWAAWIDATWMVTARTWVLAAWVGLVALRPTYLKVAHAAR